MRESLEEPVSIVWYYNAKLRHMQPHILTWNNQDYHLGKIDFWHKTWSGKHQIHHFSIADKGGGVYFKLALNTDSLQWVLEEYMTAQDMAIEYRRIEA
ncbi:hypothetical protein H0V99_03145 [Candidatus Saccharibacteria bacterium]|nr:hypothetical protein [Candidatus Saccharibacteria bacterium]